MLRLSNMWNNKMFVVNRCVKNCPLSVQKYALDNDGNNLLHLATKLKNEIMVRDLLDKKFEPNVVNNYGDTPLHMSSYVGDYNCINALCSSKKINVDVQNYCGNTALHHATMNGHYKCAEILIDNGTNPNIKNKLFKTPIFYAMMFKYNALLKLLCEMETIDINVKDYLGNTVLQNALVFGHYREMETILKYAKNVDTSNIDTSNIDASVKN